MAARNPLGTVEELTAAINAGDLEAALTLYEPNGALVVQPGQVATGRAALRNALAGFIALKATLTTSESRVIETDDVALYCSRWSLRGTTPDGKEVEMNGRSSDVLKRQSDGTWLIAIDNPWGAAILSQANAAPASP